MASGTKLATTTSTTMSYGVGSVTVGWAFISAGINPVSND